MLLVMGICSIFAVAQMCIMSSFGGLDILKEHLHFCAKYSIGNMGFTSTTCSKLLIDWSHPEEDFKLIF